MTRKGVIFVFTLLIAFAFISNASFAAKSERDFFKHQARITKNIRSALAGAESHDGSYQPPSGTQTLGADRISRQSPGMEIGITTHDFQHNCRTNRQIDWRASEYVHMIWFKQTDSTTPGGNGGTGYEVWDADAGAFVFEGIGGGCDIHPRLGADNFSGYIGIDVDTEDKVVITNHHTEGVGYATTVWYDFLPSACFFSPYKSRLPDTLMKCCVSPEEITNNEWRMVWPAMEYSVGDGDTITHVIAHQLTNEIRSSKMCYYRRVGSDTLGSWQYPCYVIDTVPVIGEQISASRVTGSGKVSIAWLAAPGRYPGDPESMIRDTPDPGLGVQRFNEVYTITSLTKGATWGPKVNVTQYDSTQGGWLCHGDLNCLIGTDDVLHVVFPAREIWPTDSSADGGLGEYAHFWGSRLFHYDDTRGEMRPIKDANWDLPDSGCTGGAWNEMSIGKPQISECDGKLYTIFVQFNDIYGGIDNDCAAGRYDGTISWNGAANGEIYVSISDDGGFTWDPARNITNTYTSHCYAPDQGPVDSICDADHYPSMARFGMEVIDGDFTDVPIADMGVTYTGNHYLDVEYINDKHPGSVYQGDGVWTTSPVLWLRVPCVEPERVPVLVYSPSEIGPPAWTKPGVSLPLPVTMENVGNAALTINSVTLTENDPPGSASLTGFIGGSVPSGGAPVVFNINILHGSPALVTGTADIHSDSYNEDSHDYVTFEIIVADTVQPPEYKDIRTECVRLTFNNAGNLGRNGIGDYNLDYFDDCDTTGNEAGDDDRANVYLYDASPFVCYVDGVDTLLYYYMFNANWLTDDGFKPLFSPVADSSTYDDYQYGYSSKFVTPDTGFAVEVEFFAPTHPDTCDFIVMKQRFYSLGGSYTGMFIGDAMDWDIPSDSSSANQSDYEEARKFMWQTGFDYHDSSASINPEEANNECVQPDDLRHGGYSYYAGFALPYGGVDDSIGDPRAMWTENNADWVYPEGGFVASQIYEKCENTTGYETWEATGDFSNPDSQATDLHMITVFGQYDLTANDTLVFCKIIVSEYDGGTDAIKESVDKAKAWIAGHNIFVFPVPPETCCVTPGNANGNDPPAVNILDITYLIAYLYQGGPPPPCCPEGDANGNCTINILDITYLIAYLYQDGPVPVCADCPDEEWCHTK
jgi:hypothetical protein